MSSSPHLTIGLTGGIGSGKSAVAKAFMALGIPVVCTDTIAREHVEPGQPALAEIASEIGADLICADGTLDRRALRQRIVADAAAKARLEAIVHPRIRAEVARRLAMPSDAPYRVVDIPLLAESGDDYRPLLSRVLVVDADDAVRMQRVVVRDGVDATAARQLMATQASREARLALADDVIVNEGSLEELADRVMALDRLYRMLAHPSQAG